MIQYVFTENYRDTTGIHKTLTLHAQHTDMDASLRLHILLNEHMSDVIVRFSNCLTLLISLD